MARTLPAWKQAERDFEGFFKTYGKKAFVHRLTDTAAAKATGGAKAFVVAQPSDYIVTIQGVGTAFAEVKTSKHKTSFPHSNIQPKQLASARRIIMAGGAYLFFIKNLLTGIWYLLPAQVILNNRASKSTRWADIEKYQWDPLNALS